MQGDGAQRALLGVGIDIDQHDLGMGILDLTQDGVARGRGEPAMAENNLARLRVLEPALEDRESFSVFGQKGGSYAGHSSVLTDFSRNSML